MAYIHVHVTFARCSCTYHHIILYKKIYSCKVFCPILWYLSKIYKTQNLLRNLCSYGSQTFIRYNMDGALSGYKGVN